MVTIRGLQPIHKVKSLSVYPPQVSAHQSWLCWKGLLDPAGGGGGGRFSIRPPPGLMFSPSLLPPSLSPSPPTQLAYCVVQFLEKDSSLTEPVSFLLN